MSDPKWTALRHRILRDINAGRMRVFIGMGESLVRTVKGSEHGDFLRGAHKRQAELLSQAWSAPGRRGCVGTTVPAVLTDSGRELLRAYDAEHPEIAEEEQ